MASKRKRVTIGVGVAAAVVITLGVGIGTANAATRRPWWDRWHPKPVASASAKPSPSVTSSATPSPAPSSAAPSASAPAPAPSTSAPASPVPSPSATKPGTFATPPANATFDYQIGGPYTPPSGVTVVSRDYTATPAAGIYNICYVNAFQTQPDAESWWKTNHPELLLKDKNGKIVEDEDWGELFLDFSTDAKRTALTTIVGGWIDQCATKGFKAVEPDNLDTYTRSNGLLTEDQAVAYSASLAAYAHGKGLAIGQKNTAELSTAKAKKAGFDFAVAEECGTWGECGAYTATYGNNVIVIEYDQSGFTKACNSHGSKVSVVQRDRDVTAPGSKSYVWKAC
ncbi:endo alpha-1,4 polygalactosaminidase [Catenuloplanes japonicus]|uniref:endo alpha-1,4 polygalactosaminidase n=1 Tax=Catenuloplanes japonicus TaxID=33876 RepID=UPI000527E956|nr:endo alpha-1,4 polygalactosaminidase [Catenuloplanes japonicus]